MNPSLSPICSFEILDPKDIPSAIQSNSRNVSKQLIRIAPLGLGYETFLKWAVQDIDAASGPETVRFSVNALMNARRSLSCLADQYLLRDCFTFCSDVPRTADKKAELLFKRGIFDSLATRALERAVTRRNQIEHDYCQVSLSDAQDTVHLIRSTIENCVQRSDPYKSPGLFGTFLGGHSSGPHGVQHRFEGWSGVLFVFARTESEPWLGIVVPSSNVHATVRKTLFSSLTCEELLRALVPLEKQSTTGYSEYGEPTFAAQLTSLGLR